MYRFFVDLLEPFLVLYVLTALMLANLWRKPAESRRRLLLVTVPFLGLTLLCTPAISYFALGSLEWLYPPCADRPEDVKAIVVLSGGMRPPDGVRKQPELKESTLCRCLQAARLYRQGEPCLVVASGGKVDPAGPGPTLAEAMRDFLLRHGVAQGDLLIEDRSRTTYENAAETAKLLRRRVIGKVVLVTDALHLLRAQRCFEAQGIEVVPSGCRYRATRLRWSLFSFLPSAGAARGTQEALHEWLGIVWYRLHGRI